MYQVKTHDLLLRIASDANLERAYHWLCQARVGTHYNNDVWHLRRDWATLKPQLQNHLLSGKYYFAPCRNCRINGTWLTLWTAQDALVLKAIALVLTATLAPHLSQQCYHLPGRGGLKGCVRDVQRHLPHYAFICRSDVDSYYATMDHDILMDQLRQLVYDEGVIELIRRMLARVDDIDAELRHATVGITKGNPLSPLLGAIYLHSMDQNIVRHCRRHGLRYFRYMDDWLILCRTRHQLRALVKIMQTGLQQVKQTHHPLKTYIGRIKHGGIDFLGYRIAKAIGQGLKIAYKTWMNHQTKLLQLYEQHTDKDHRVAAYRKRWLRWVNSGLQCDMETLANALECEHALREYFCIVT